MTERPAERRETGTAADRRAVRVEVTGTVQGVGFRPFVARTATTRDLTGRVRNTDRGVVVTLEGDPTAVAGAIETIRSDPPPLADVQSVTVTGREPTTPDGFSIVDSSGGDDRAALVPPDTGMCPECRTDLRDPDSRYHGYWATACVNCGPRFTITASLPYDRERTAMDGFSPCEGCQSAYESVTDRRFHAQTVACPDCGPSVRLLEDDAAGGDATEGSRSPAATGTAAIDALAAKLADGEVVAVKGAGGAHLCCRATDPAVVGRLRDRLGRPGKPFALMAPSVASVREFASVSEAERATLTDQRRPIVVLERADTSPGVPGDAWLDAVAPGLHTVGVMLPYSGLHHLLFDRLSEPIVATSANRPGAPMCTTAEELRALDAPDAVVTHGREILNRCDDSVVRHVDGDRRFLRRSRGWVPAPLDRPVDPGGTVLAVGGRADVTVAVADGDRVVPSQHIGEVAAPAAERFHRSATDHLLKLLEAEPDVVAHDRHPEFRTTTVAADRAATWDTDAIGVYHHHAHAASLLAEHDRERAIVVAADGTGYGPDGVVRGGEVLDSTLAGSERVGGLSEFRLPGGERAVERPGRILASLLGGDGGSDSDGPAADAGGLTDLLVARGAAGTATEATIVREVATDDRHSPVTTSAGRYLDAMSALLDVCTRRRYRGEPALRLEATAALGDPVDLDPPVERSGEGTAVVRVDRAAEQVASLAATESTADAAATAQAVLADGLAAVAVRAATERGIDAVGFTGGVAYNDAISRRLRRAVQAADRTFLGHRAVPPGDAGLAYGQAVTASARLASEAGTR